MCKLLLDVQTRMYLLKRVGGNKSFLGVELKTSMLRICHRFPDNLWNY